MKHLLTTFALLLVLSASVRADLVNPFYPVEQFNTVIFGDLTYTGGTDNMGYMAVGGSVHGKSNGFGVATSVGTQAGDVSLVVGGDLNVSAGQIYGGGDYYIGGSISNPVQFNLGSGNSLETCPVDFSALQTELRSYSTALVDMGVDVTPVANTWNSQFNVTTGTLNILNAYASDLNGSLTSLQLNGMDASTQVVINVIGDSDYNVLSMQYGETQGSWAWGNNVMINLVDIDEFTVTSHGQNNFSILAVDTDVIATNTNFEGLLVANNVTLTNAEFHNGRPFEPEIDLPSVDPNPGAATPEPGTALMLLVGMAGFPIYRRFRKRTA